MPVVFVFSPSLLLVVPGFDWIEFLRTLAGCLLGVTCLAAALSDYLLVRMQSWERLLAGAAGLLLIAPGWGPLAAGAILVSPVVLRHALAARRGEAA